MKETDMDINAWLGLVLVAVVVAVVAVVVLPGLTWYVRVKEWCRQPDNVRHVTLTLLAATWLMLGSALGNEGVDDVRNFMAMAVIAVVGLVVYYWPAWRKRWRNMRQHRHA